MKSVRTLTRNAMVRFPRTTAAISAVALGAFLASVVLRVVDSPIRATSTWTAATVIGVAAGAAGTAGWAWIGLHQDSKAPWRMPFMWITALALLVALGASVHRYGNQPTLDSAFLVGAAWFLVTSLIGVFVALGITIAGRRSGESAPAPTIAATSVLQPRRSRRKRHSH